MVTGERTVYDKRVPTMILESTDKKVPPNFPY